MERRKMQELESVRANQSNGAIDSKSTSDGEGTAAPNSSNGRCSSSNGYLKDNGDRSGWQAAFDKTISSEDRPSSSASVAEIGFNEDLLCEHSMYIFLL